MLYEELDKSFNFKNNTKRLYNAIELLIRFADKNNFKYYICGGIALAIFNKGIYRRNNDLEIAVDINQEQDWIDFLEKNGFEFVKDSSSFPLGNKKKVFLSQDAVMIEIIFLKDGLINKDNIIVNIKDLNIHIYEPMKIFDVKLFYVDKINKTMRTKDKTDLLHFKQYLLDNIQKSS